MIRFFFPADRRERLPLSLARRVPILVGTNFLLIFYFLLASVTRYRGDPEGSLAFVVAVGSTELLFFASLFLVRAEHYRSASLVGTVAVLLNVIWLGTLLPIESASDIYRFATYVIASGVSNYLIAIDRRQVLAYSVASTGAFVIILLVLYVPALAETQGTQVRVIASTVLMLMVAVDICLIIMERLADDLVSAAEAGQEEHRARAAALSSLLDGSTHSLGIGDDLVRAAADATEAGRLARSGLNAILDDASRLAKDVAEVDRSNRNISTKAEAMKEYSRSQSTFLVDTGAAIKAMLMKIRALSEDASQRTLVLERAIQGLAGQLDRARAVSSGMSSVSNASRSILGVASGIADVAEKTNLLAMNASIEAAHAGSSGKGFGVIAQEIRALSAVARTNTDEIGKVLSRSDVTVQESVRTVEAFVSELQALNKGVHEAFEGMAGIVGGLSGVSADAVAMQDTIDEMVATSRNVSAGAEVVADTITASGVTLASVAGLAAELRIAADRSAGSFDRIEKALESVAATGNENRSQVATLEKRLREVGSSSCT